MSSAYPVEQELNAEDAVLANHAVIVLAGWSRATYLPGPYSSFTFRLVGALLRSRSLPMRRFNF
jgi:hypothetical protein